MDDRQRVLKWLMAARRQTAAGRHDLAFELLAECLALEPDNSLVAQEFLTSWQNLLRASVPQSGWGIRPWIRRSIRTATARLQRNPHDPGALTALITELDKVASSEVLAWLVPGLCAHLTVVDPTVSKVAAEALTEIGRCEDALQWWKRLCEQRPEHEDARRWVAGLEAVIQAGEAAAASTEWGDPDERELVSLEARAAEAARQAEQWGDPRWQRCSHQLADHYRDVAIDIYRRRVDRFPHRQEWRAKLIRLLEAAGSNGAATTILQSAPRPIEHPALLFEQARCQQRNLDFEDALDAYAQAIDRLEELGDGELTVRLLVNATELASAMGKHELAAEWRSLQTQKCPGRFTGNSRD